LTAFAKTDRNRITRLAKRGHYDRATINHILDEALVCHVGFVEQHQPYVLPINFARLGATIVMHGSKTSRLLTHIAAGHPVCVEVTLVDGLVLARSVFHHSINYRSVVLFGTGHLVEADSDKLAALSAMMEQLIPGRWQAARQPTQQELNATSVVAIPIDHASAKIRRGPPGDDPADAAWPLWAGVLPLQVQALAPVPDTRMPVDVGVPEYLTNYARNKKD